MSEKNKKQNLAQSMETNNKFQETKEIPKTARLSLVNVDSKSCSSEIF